MPVDVKFCGLTRPEDAAEAARLAAGHVGVIFAGGPRRIDAARAAEIFRALPDTVRRVGVFGSQTPDEIAAVVRDAALDIVQLHGDPAPADVDAVRARAGAEVWAVLRVGGSELPMGVAALAATADAILLDARVDGALGGTGRRLEWAALAGQVDRLRRDGGCRLVLAGGLTPESVERAIELLAPDIVDVSSGVESAPGIKDHARMRAFTEAVRRAGAMR